MIGLSGGKDSYSLLDLLLSRRRCLPIDFELQACHVQAIDMNYRADINFMQQYCNQHNVPLHLQTIEVQYNPEGRKPACFICSWKRRKMLFDTAKRHGCNKLALGHNLDDTIETLLMNMINHGSICAIPPSLSMFGGEITMIRPLSTCHNSELRRYAQARAFPNEMQKCDFENNTLRADIKQLIHTMTEINRDARDNLYRSTQNIFFEYLPPTKNLNGHVLHNDLNINHLKDSLRINPQSNPKDGTAHDQAHALEQNGGNACPARKSTST